MNLTEIKKILDENLNKEPTDGKERIIIFWYDQESEFVDDINDLILENAKILHLTENNSFYIKYLIEKEDAISNYLIYSPNSKPHPRENYLLDIEKYSEEFSTDKVTVIMKDLCVKDENLRHVFKKYIKFFANKERYKKFASYNIKEFTEEIVDFAIISALCKINIVDFELILKTILMEETKEENKIIEEINKFGDINAFWVLVEKRYGYHLQEKSLEQLMIMFLITNLSYTLDAKMPATWEKFISPKTSDCVVFVNHFMNHSSDSNYYDLLVQKIESNLNLNDYLNKWNIDDYIMCDTFIAFDEKIISYLINNLIDNIGEFEQYRKIINRRRTTHYFSKLKNHYEAIYFAMEILRFKHELKYISGSTAYEIMDNYVTNYYLFDLFYRKFYLYYDKNENKDKLFALVEVVENTYANWYLDELSAKWSKAAEDELINDFKLCGVAKQQEFYQDFVQKQILDGERVFVIISDALRYEIAKEFCDILNKDIRGKSETSYMLGVIPSYTKLGMAALLPHKKIEITQNSDILVDEVNSSGTENRQSILSKYCHDSLAIQYNDIKDYKRSDYKETFEGKKLIYIYHNVIDAIGDKAITERDVFKSAEQSFDDLSNLVKNLVNNLSATNIYITADHGFIYKRSPLQEYDKISKSDVNSIEEGRRFILSEEKTVKTGTLSIPMNYLLGNNTNLNAIVPKGAVRFKVQGAGDNYVHGGASLQEIVIPVIKFKNIRKDEFKSSKAEVKLTNISRKITNRITYLEFFQTEKVEEKKLPMRLKIYFEDEDKTRISNECIVIADSRSSNPADRTYREKFTLKDKSYDKSKKYYLVLEDEDETVEKIYDKVPFIIDLAIINDFGF